MLVNVEHNGNTTMVLSVYLYRRPDALLFLIALRDRYPDYAYGSSVNGGPGPMVSERSITFFPDNPEDITAEKPCSTIRFVPETEEEIAIMNSSLILESPEKDQIWVQFTNHEKVLVDPETAWENA